MTEQRVSAERLLEVIRAAFTRRGLSAEHADYVARGLVEPSLRGIDTHGVALLETYLHEIEGGRARAEPEFTWRDAGSAGKVLDAGGALGLVAGRVGCAGAVALAKANGVGVVVVRNSNHFGAASYYTVEMARHGVLGFSCTNSDALVAPFGGATPLIGTNPLSATVTAGDELFSADFATSQVAYSRIKRFREAGKPLEDDWAEVDAEGQVAALRPLGGSSGYKGEGLGLLVEILCAVLAGEPLDHELSHLYEPPYDTPRRVAHFFLALDIGAFTDRGGFEARLATLLATIRGAGEGVMAPGDPEARAAAQRSARGIPLTAAQGRVFRRLEAELEQMSGIV
jgi:LDH2 family malate/lactate/ureidoglycolate dehydrogenase